MYRVGIDLGGTNIKVGIVDENQKIIVIDSVPTMMKRSANEVIKDMAKLVESLINKAELNRNDISGVGIGCPGTIDSINGMVLYSNNLNWEDVPLVDELQDLLQYPIRVSNDANCAAIGEVKAGAAKDLKNIVLLTLGTGVGSGIILNGKIFEGGHPGGAELGHTILVKNGRECTCGRKGCFEAYASATALIQTTKEMVLEHKKSLILKLCEGDLEKIDGKMVFDAFEQGDEVATKIIEEYISYLGDGIVDIINVFRPDKILLSGGICYQGKTLTDPLNAYVKKYCFAGKKAMIPNVNRASLGNSAGIIGAAALLEM